MTTPDSNFTKHPGDEAWADFLFGELPAADHQTLDQHLAECSACRDQLAQLKKISSELHSWKLDPAPRLAAAPLPRWTWAAAAIVCLGIFTAAWFTSGAHTSRVLTKQMESTIQSEVSRQAAALLKQQSERFAQFDARLRDLATQESLDYSNLRRELETVALNAQESLEGTQQQLYRLAVAAKSNQN